MTIAPTRTVSALVTLTEQSTVRDAAAVAKVSVSSWLGQRMSMASSNKAGIQTIRDDINRISARRVSAKERITRVSTILAQARHSEFTDMCAREGFTVHAAVQALAICAAERELNRLGHAISTAPLPPTPPPVRNELARLFDMLTAMITGAMGEDQAAELTAGMRLRVMSKGTVVGNGMITRARRDVERLAERDRDQCHMVAGWLRLAPHTVLTACQRKALEVTYQVAPVAMIGPDVEHADAVEDEIEASPELEILPEPVDETRGELEDDTWSPPTFLRKG